MPRILCLALAMLATVPAWSQATQNQATQRRRVAVFDFDNAAVQGGISSPLFQMKAPDVGKAVAELLIARLVQDGQVSVIERAALDKLIAEQNFGNSDRTDPLTAAKLGKLLGVDAIILGTIARYDYTDKTSGGGSHFPFGGGSIKVKHDIKAKVLISTRLVSTDTAEVLSVSEGTGEIERKVKRNLGEMNNNVLMGQTNDPIMNECIEKAISQLALSLEQEVSKVPQHIPVVEGLVADADDSGKLVLNVGARDGVKVGDHLQVLRVGKEIRDPSSGKLLLRDDKPLGEAIVVTVDDTFAIARYQGTEPVKVRDLVRSVKKQ